MMKLKRCFTLIERNEIIEKSQKCLWVGDGKPGRDYLRDRGLSVNVARKFGLGFIPYSVRHQLAGRIILPIWDASGNAVAITSRRISEGDTALPVYWHESYEKSFHLYGIQLAFSSMRRWKFALVVEGQFDVIQLHNHGMTNAVGLCSTNLSDMQLALIHRYCDDVVLLFDKDSNLSGQKGIKKAMHLTEAKAISGAGKNVFGGIFQRVNADRNSDRIGYKIVPVFFKTETDPDNFVRSNGIHALKELIKKPLIEMRRRHGSAVKYY